MREGRAEGERDRKWEMECENSRVGSVSVVIVAVCARGRARWDCYLKLP